MTIRKSGRRTRERVSALRKTAGLLLVTLLLSLVGVVSTATSASASIQPALCSGYAACVAAGYTDHGYGANNGNQYWHEFAGDNCTNYAAFLEVENGFSTQTQYSPGDAANWGSYFSSYKNSTPAVGSIAWWGGSQGDHVAYVESIAYNPDGSVSSFTASEDNWGGSFDWRVYLASDSANWPSGFLHFKDTPPTPTYTHANIAWDQGGTLYQLSGQSSGAFGVAGSTTGIGSATWVAGGYFRANGKPQVVSYSASTGTLTEFEWNGSSWVWVNNTTGIGSPDWAVVGNFSGNGHDGIAWDQGGTLYYLSGQSDGSFGFGGSTTGIGPATWVGAGGFRADGKAQVASYSSTTGTLTEFEWNGSSWVWVNNTTGIGSPDWAVTGDFNNTGHSDIAWDQGGTLYQLSGQTDGSFSFGGSTTGIGPATWVGAGDFRADGKAEIVSYSAATGTITEFESTGSSFVGVNNTIDIGVPNWAVTNGSDK